MNRKELLKFAADNKIKIIEEMQQVVAQMKLDDIEENPNIVQEYFSCDCCGKTQTLAGSIRYGDYRLCNDCVLYFKNKQL